MSGSETRVTHEKNDAYYAAKQERKAWIIGSQCAIHSKSKHVWFEGEITDAFTDTIGEWLNVRYIVNGIPRNKQIQRFSDNIRPMPQSNANKPEQDADDDDANVEEKHEAVEVGDTEDETEDGTEEETDEESDNCCVVVKIYNGDDATFDTFNGDSTLVDLLGKLGDKKSHSLYDMKNNKIYDLDARIKDFAQFESASNTYVIKARDNDSNVGKEYIDLPESKLNEMDLSLPELEKAGYTMKDMNKLFSDPSDGNTDYDQVECLEPIDKKRLFKGNRRLLYGRIPSSDGFNKAGYRMFNLKSNIDWDDVLFSDLKRDTKIIESRSSMEKAMAESSYLSAEVKVKAWGFAASAGYSQDSQEKSAESSEYYALTARTTITQAQVMVNDYSVEYTPQFMTDLNYLLDNDITYISHWKRFLNKYGYFYVSKAQLGGTLYMSDESDKQQQSKSSSSKSSMRASMEADMFFVTASASAAYESGSSKQNSSSEEKSNKTLCCNGGRPDLCTFNNFSEWEESLNDHKLWDVTNAIGIEPFYNLLNYETRLKLFELMPDLNNVEAQSGPRIATRDIQVSDFYGTKSAVNGFYSGRNVKTQWINRDGRSIRDIKYIDNVIMHGFAFALEPKYEDYKKESDVKNVTEWGYGHVSDYLDINRNIDSSKSIELDKYTKQRDLKVIELKKTEVINKANIWMDPAGKTIIGLQFVTNTNGNKINVIPPGFMALQLICGLYNLDEEKRAAQMTMQTIEDKPLNYNIIVSSDYNKPDQYDMQEHVLLLTYDQLISESANTGVATTAMPNAYVEADLRGIRFVTRVQVKGCGAAMNNGELCTIKNRSVHGCVLQYRNMNYEWETIKEFTQNKMPSDKFTEISLHKEARAIRVWTENGIASCGCLRVFGNHTSIRVESVYDKNKKALQYTPHLIKFEKKSEENEEIEQCECIEADLGCVNYVEYCEVTMNCNAYVLVKRSYDGKWSAPNIYYSYGRVYPGESSQICIDQEIEAIRIISTGKVDKDTIQRMSTETQMKDDDRFADSWSCRSLRIHGKSLTFETSDRYNVASTRMQSTANASFMKSSFFNNSKETRIRMRQYAAHKWYNEKNETKQDENEDSALELDDDMNQSQIAMAQADVNEADNVLFRLVLRLSKHPRFDYDAAIAIADELRGHKNDLRSNREEILKLQYKQFLDSWEKDEKFDAVIGTLCRKYEAIGDKLVDIQVVDDTNAYSMVEGIQFKFVMYN
eukprot:201870_1